MRYNMGPEGNPQAFGNLSIQPVSKWLKVKRVCSPMQIQYNSINFSKVDLCLHNWSWT